MAKPKERDRDSKDDERGGGTKDDKNKKASTNDPPGPPPIGLIELVKYKRSYIELSTTKGNNCSSSSRPLWMPS